MRSMFILHILDILAAVDSMFMRPINMTSAQKKKKDYALPWCYTIDPYSKIKLIQSDSAESETEAFSCKKKILKNKKLQTFIQKNIIICIYVRGTSSILDLWVSIYNWE